MEADTKLEYYNVSVYNDLLKLIKQLKIPAICLSV